MATTEWILDQPPALCQLQLYKGTEGMFGCWATCAEMVIKWKNRNSYFGRPNFESLLYWTDGQGKAEYLAYVLDYLEGYGFAGQNNGGFGVWSSANLASYLYWKGPLIATGKFGAGLGTDQMHDITVFGVKNGQVHYIDPMDATVKQISTTSFQEKLWKSYNAVMARTTNYRNN
jgi:hypothetical protein